MQPDLRLENGTLKAITGQQAVGVDLDKLGDEWRMYQLETIPEDWHMKGEEPLLKLEFGNFQIPIRSGLLSSTLS